MKVQPCESSGRLAGVGQGAAVTPFFCGAVKRRRRAPFSGRKGSKAALLAEMKSNQAGNNWCAGMLLRLRGVEGSATPPGDDFEKLKIFPVVLTITLVERGILKLGNFG